MGQAVDVYHIDLVAVPDHHCVLRGQLHELQPRRPPAHPVALRVSDLVLAEVALPGALRLEQQPRPLGILGLEFHEHHIRK